jgi:myo-inositol catabolism protein IolC
LVGFLVVVELELILGLELAGLADTAGFGVAVLLALVVGFGVGVTAYELVVNKVVANKIDTNILIFIVYSI